jgi:hypothetical protein
LDDCKAKDLKKEVDVYIRRVVMKGNKALLHYVDPPSAKTAPWEENAGFKRTIAKARWGLAGGRT